MRFLLAILLLTACSAQAEYVCQSCVEVVSTATPTVTPTSTATPAPTAQVITFHEDTNAIFASPGVGWQTTQVPITDRTRFQNIHNLPSTSEVFRLYAEEVNSAPGVFNWSLVDNARNRALAAGQTLNFRFVMFDPYGGSWLRNHIPGRNTRCTTEGGGTYFAPDFDSPVTQQRHKELIDAFAARYGNDPTIEHVDAGSHGSYAEWHHYCQVIAGTSTALPLPSQASRRLIMKHYNDALPTKTKVLILDDIVSRTEGKNYGFGWRADCWHGHHETSLYPGWLANPDMTQVWQNAPVLLEPCGNISSWGDIGVAVDQAIARRASLINSKNYVDISAAQLPEIRRLLRKLGYRFVVRQARVDGGTTFTIENVGIAPNYSPITLKFAGESKTLDKIMPGTVVQRSFLATAGTLTAEMGSRPVRFANVEAIAVQ